MFNYILRIYYASLGKTMSSDYKYSQSYTEWLIDDNTNLDIKTHELQSQLAELKQINIELIQKINKLGSRTICKYNQRYTSTLDIDTITRFSCKK